MTEDYEENSRQDERGISVSGKFLKFMFLGLLLVAFGTVIVILAATGGDSASFGGVVFIGPFPIVIGLGPDWNLLVAAGIILAALSIAAFVIMYRRI